MVFLIAVWADPSQPARYPAEAYAVLAAYVAISAAYLVATWNNWWLEHRLAVAAHCFDIALFGVMVYLTEGYTSPFFTFFVFIILSSTIRWSWRETAATALAIILLFFVAGFAATRLHDANFEITRFLIRGTYLVVLSLLLIWFAFNQQGRFLRQLPAAKLKDRWASAELPIRMGLEQAAARTAAKRATLVWWDAEEPWVNLAQLEAGELKQERHPPAAFGSLVDPRVADTPFIFDSGTGRILARRSGRVEAITDVRHPLDLALSARIGSDSGLVVPVRADAYGALFVLTDVPGLCTDDLEIGERLGEDYSLVLQRSSMQNILEEAAANRTRLALARDLHDSVAQLLAGTSLRLEGLKQAARSGRSVEEELETLQQELRTEQQDLRGLIGQLRSGTSGRQALSLRDSLSRTLKRLSGQWGVPCSLERCPEVIGTGSHFEHELGQLIREAIANAVRHGRASHIAVSVDLAGAELSLRVRDNGGGFVVDGGNGDGATPAPWSLNERVHELGGSLMLASTFAGSEITMLLPWRARS